MRGVNFFVLLLCYLFVRAQQLKFSTKPPPGMIKARIGEDVTFNWTVTLDDRESLPLIQFQYSRTKDFDESTRMVANKYADRVTITDPFQGKVNVSNTGALTLHNVTTNQRGYYKCTVTLLRQGTSITTKAHLVVGIPPTIQSSLPSMITKLEGNNVEFKCKASGTPTPDVLWYKMLPDGWTNIGVGHVLLIKKLKISDSGLYECRAWNFMKTETKSVNLTVYERPTVTAFFHTSALDDTVYECESTTIMCEARSNSSPLKQISIYHGGRLVYPGINNDRVTSHGASNTRLISGRRYEHLRIENTTKEYEGIYYCVVENEHGVGYNRSIYLKVLDAPKNCGRKRSLTTSRTTKQQRTSISPTVSDYTFATTKKKIELKAYSSSTITRPNLLLLALFMCFFFSGNFS